MMTQMSLVGDWEVVNHWLTVQTNFHVKISPRSLADL